MTKELKYAHEALDIQIASLSSHNNNIPIPERIGDQRVFLDIMVRAAEAERNARNEREREQWKRTVEAGRLRAEALAFFAEIIEPRAEGYYKDFIREELLKFYVRPENVHGYGEFIREDLFKFYVRPENVRP